MAAAAAGDIDALIAGFESILMRDISDTSITTARLKQYLVEFIATKNLTVQKELLPTAIDQPLFHALLPLLVPEHQERLRNVLVDICARTNSWVVYVRLMRCAYYFSTSDLALGVKSTVVDALLVKLSKAYVFEGTDQQCLEHCESFMDLVSARHPGLYPTMTKYCFNFMRELLFDDTRKLIAELQHPSSGIRFRTYSEGKEKLHNVSERMMGLYYTRLKVLVERQPGLRDEFIAASQQLARLLCPHLEAQMDRITRTTIEDYSNHKALSEERIEHDEYYKTLLIALFGFLQTLELDFESATGKCLITWRNTYFLKVQLRDAFLAIAPVVPSVCKTTFPKADDRVCGENVSEVVLNMTRCKTVSEILEFEGQIRRILIRHFSDFVTPDASMLALARLFCPLNFSAYPEEVMLKINAQLQDADKITSAADYNMARLMSYDTDEINSDLVELLGNSPTPGGTAAIAVGAAAASAAAATGAGAHPQGAE